MSRAARLTSVKLSPSPPLMLNTTPLALSIDESSNGLEMAAEAASSAPVLPDPMPIPMSAVPALDMTLRTSAKSTLIRPGLTMISEIPTTPCLKISSATAKARFMGVSSGMISNNRSLLTTITVSTCCFNRSIAATACLILLFPSNLNGLVTIPMVNAPASLETSATTGAAPLPVPPPMPLVTKHKSVPSTIAAISARDSSAANCPTSGLPPAPKPRVAAVPIFNTLAPLALERPNACASVLRAQKSTPETRVSSMRSTALQPPPPTPTTLMTQGESPPSGMTASPVIDRAVLRLVLVRELPRRVIPAKDPRSGCHPLATAEAKDISYSMSLSLALPSSLVMADKTIHRCDEADIR
mmetsp:Transcript_23573/g.51055  ORF Transcript_23573/g.51055 Transcript_23573/m.51055 type:complete len:356 (+) Transcript_23573:726-1793(+)